MNLYSNPIFKVFATKRLSDLVHEEDLFGKAKLINCK